MVRVPATIERDRASEAEVAALLGGHGGVPTNAASFVDMAIHHRVAPLLVRAGIAPRLPPAEAARLRQRARDEAVAAEVRDRELCRVLCAVRAAGIDVLLMKGAHLAHSHYPESYLRQRDDADVLVQSADRGRLARILVEAGYTQLPDITGAVVLGQMLFAHDATGVALDVHWQIAARRVAADLLRFDELRARSIRLPRLCVSARGLSPVHALAVGCIHQSAHHPEHDLLLWAYDTYLLVSHFTEQEGDEFVALTIERGMVRLAVYALHESVQFFPTAASRALLARLSAQPRVEATAFLVAPRTPLTDFLSDMSATRGWVARARLLGGHLFPPMTYMRHTYGIRRPAALPWFYAYRILRGAGRWFREKL